MITNRKSVLQGDSLWVLLPLMGASCLYGWSDLLGMLHAGSRGESICNIVIPLLMALLWRYFERRRVRTLVALGCTVLGFSATLMMLYGDAAMAVVGVQVRFMVNAAMLLLWCWIYGRLPISQSAVVFGGMQVGSFVLAVLFFNLPLDTYPGLALCMPILCFVLFQMAQRQVEDKPERNQSDLKLSLKRDLRWKMLIAAFFCAMAFGLVKAAPSGWFNILSFGCSGTLLIVAATLFRHRASTQTIFNISLPLIVAGLAVASIVGVGMPALAEVLTGTGYALMMALFTIMLADRAYRFGLPIIWSVGIVRAVLGAGRLLGVSFASAAQVLPLHDQLVTIGAMVAVLIASIAWMQDSLSVTKAALVGETHEELALLHGKEERLQDRDDDMTANALKRRLLDRCGEVSEEYCLSSREKEVLECLAFGWSAPRIEEKLVISNSTVKTHVRHIYSKLGVHSRDELKMLLGVDAF